MPRLVLRTLVRADVEVVFDAALHLERTAGRPLPAAPAVRVVAVERPGRFVGEVRGGVLAELRHEHRFEVEGPRMTIMTDRVQWRSRPPAAGALLDAVWVRRALLRLLAERSAEVTRRAEGSG